MFVASKRSLNNYYIFADLGVSPVCMLDDSVDAQDTDANNTCVHQTGSVYEWQRYQGCGPGKNLNQTAEITCNNRFFTTDGEVHIKCKNETWSLEQYQKKGYDMGSTVAELPPPIEIVQWAAHLFEPKHT